MVDFRYFHSLTPAEARSLLEGFLDSEAGTVEQTLAKARREGLSTDYSIESLPALMRWALGQLKTVPMPEDPSVPIWIRETDVYKRGLYDFDEPSKSVVLRVTYYMGECFVRTFPDLTWSIGEAGTVQKHMPVVAGFAHGMELAPMLVTENLFRRVLEGNPGSDNAFENAVATWAATTKRNTRRSGTP